MEYIHGKPQKEAKKILRKLSEVSSGSQWMTMVSRRLTFFQRNLEIQSLKCVTGIEEIGDHIFDHCVRIT